METELTKHGIPEWVCADGTRHRDELRAWIVEAQYWEKRAKRLLENNEELSRDKTRLLRELKAVRVADDSLVAFSGVDVFVVKGIGK